MIYTFDEQLIMIIYFIILGMFISIMLDTIHTIFNKIKVINYILQFISWTIVNIVCIKYLDKISNGYVPIYLFLFFIIGYFIYNKFLSKSYIKIILKIKESRQNILLAIFPITLYNYIIRKTKVLIKNNNKNRKQKNEKNYNINNDINSNDSNTRVYK